MASASASGDRIVDVGWHPPRPSNTSIAQAKALEGRSILSVHRTGKHMVLELGRFRPAGVSSVDRTPPRRRSWMIHLGMTKVTARDHSRGPIAPHTHTRVSRWQAAEFALLINAASAGRFATSPGAMGSRAGAEPLTIQATIRMFCQAPSRQRAESVAARRRKGNIYAVREVSRVNIRPRRRAGQLTGLN